MLNTKEPSLFLPEVQARINCCYYKGDLVLTETVFLFFLALAEEPFKLILIGATFFCFTPFLSFFGFSVKKTYIFNIYF